MRVVYDRRQDGSGITSCYTLASIIATYSCTLLVSHITAAMMLLLLYVIVVALIVQYTRVYTKTLSLVPST